MSDFTEAFHHCIVVGNATPTQNYELVIEFFDVVLQKSQVMSTVMTHEEWEVMDKVFHQLKSTVEE